MGINRISSTLSEKDKQEVMDAVATITSKLSFLVDLNAKERKSLPRLGDRNLAFTRRALEIATQTPDFLPRSFETDELRRDFELFEALQPILLAITKLQELLDDTAVAAGGEAYAGALEVYRYAKANGNLPGLDNLTELLGQRFAQNSRRNAAQTSAAVADEE